MNEVLNLIQTLMAIVAVAVLIWLAIAVKRHIDKLDVSDDEGEEWKK